MATTEEAAIRVSPQALRRFAADALEAAGMVAEEAAIVADSLVEADLRGIETHGIMRLPQYVQRVRAGGIRSPATLVWHPVAPSCGLLDGGAGAGQVVGVRAMTRAVELAAESGVGVVVVRNSNHLGTAGYFVLRALAHNMIGLVLTNADASVVPFGGAARFFGTNPLAIGVPSGQPFPVVLDMATSIVAFGRVLVAAQSGQAIPAGWAVDDRGQPTTDPRAALAGALLPAAGHKGYGLAFMVEVLTAMLGGGPYGPHLPQSVLVDQPQMLGHFLMAIDVPRFVGLEVFTSRVDAMIAELHTVPAVKTGGQVLVPGEPEGRTYADRVRNGVPLRPAVRQELERLGPLPALG